MNRSRPIPNKPSGSSVAFLLAQVGAQAAARFAERLEPLGLAPPAAGILRVIARSDDLTQNELARVLGMFPSRLVLLLDGMERAGLVERRPRASDRRSHRLQLTAGGRRALEAIATVAQEHQKEICAGLTPRDVALLRGLLGRIAERQGLAPGVHPGYRSLGGGDGPPAAP
jgi:DNA-binding MarR family transcriptional regulator